MHGEFILVTGDLCIPFLSLDDRSKGTRRPRGGVFVYRLRPRTSRYRDSGFNIIDCSCHLYLTHHGLSILVPSPLPLPCSRGGRPPPVAKVGDLLRQPAEAEARHAVTFLQSTLYLPLHHHPLPVIALHTSIPEARGHLHNVKSTRLD